jgi:hypothetical protein
MSRARPAVALALIAVSVTVLFVLRPFDWRTTEAKKPEDAVLLVRTANFKSYENGTLTLLDARIRPVVKNPDKEEPIKQFTYKVDPEFKVKVREIDPQTDEEVKQETSAGEAFADLPEGTRVTVATTDDKVTLLEISVVKKRK